MQVTGMLYGSKLLQFVGFPTPEVLGPSASEEEIRALIDKHLPGVPYTLSHRINPSVRE